MNARKYVSLNRSALVYPPKYNTNLAFVAILENIWMEMLILGNPQSLDISEMGKTSILFNTVLITVEYDDWLKLKRFYKTKQVWIGVPCVFP